MRKIMAADSRNLRRIILPHRRAFVEYLGEVGDLGAGPCPWESAQPCRVSGQSREKCSVRNLGGRRETEGARERDRQRERGRNASHSLLVSLFFHIFKRSPFWRRSKMQRQKKKRKRKPLKCKQPQPQCPFKPNAVSKSNMLCCHVGVTCARFHVLMCVRLILTCIDRGRV